MKGRFGARIPQPPRRRDPATLPLTRRQHQVWELIAQGLREKEIARAYGLSVATIGTHTLRLYQRLGVSTRTQAALKWHERLPL